MNSKTIKTYFIPGAVICYIKQNFPQLLSKQPKINLIILLAGFHWTVWTNWKPSFLLVDHCQRSTEGSTGSADSYHWIHGTAKPAVWKGSAVLTTSFCSGDAGIFSGQVALTQADLKLKYWWTIFGSACNTHGPAASQITAVQISTKEICLASVQTGERMSRTDRVPAPLLLPPICLFFFPIGPEPTTSYSAPQPPTPRSRLFFWTSCSSSCFDK